jgi:ribonuclease R
VEKDAIIRSHTIPAFHGDIIQIQLLKTKEGKRPEANFIKVVEHKQKRFIGKLNFQKSGDYTLYFVDILSNNIKVNFYIASKYLQDAKDGDVVEINMLEWRENEKSPRAEITKVLSGLSPNELEMRTILLSKGFTQDFSAEVLEDLKGFRKEIDPKEIKERLDMREVLTLTIDPKTARDFDDALSWRKLENGTVEVGVHIADVSHFVVENTALDMEARRRATSVYLPDRVAPMLPHLLSQDLCSLNPNEDRLAFSMLYTIDPSGKITDEYLAKTIIHSNRRFTYEEAQEVITSKQGDHSEAILDLFRIAGIWRKNRFEGGSINFEAPEVQFVLDSEGKPLEIIPKIQIEANWLIEEYMLRANISVANALDVYTKKKMIPAGIYRDHDLPDLTKLEQFRQTALILGDHKLQV